GPRSPGPPATRRGRCAPDASAPALVSRASRPGPGWPPVVRCETSPAAAHPPPAAARVRRRPARRSCEPGSPPAAGTGPGYLPGWLGAGEEGDGVGEVAVVVIALWFVRQRVHLVRRGREDQH